ncbi:hypothetical protein GCM10029992_28320 [Glycomyces albus]
MFAVNSSRSSRVETASKLMVTVLPVDGSKVYPAASVIVWNDDPPPLPRISMVWARVSQAGSEGSPITTWSTSAVAPRSTWSHCGNESPALSQ